MNKKQFLLIANGELDCRQFEKLDWTAIDTIIAADGGAVKALECGIEPDIVIGDLDSITPEVRQRLTGTRIIHKPSQESNDLEKALDYCLQHQVYRLIILGLTRGRLDHTLNNFSVLSRYDRKLGLEIYDRYARIYFVRDRFEFTGEAGQLVSLIPLGEVNGVTTRGLKYPLNGERLAFGIREGLSNVITENPVKIEIKDGLLLVFVNYSSE